MKNIYFVQTGFEFDGSAYLPYAAGTIIAYSKQFPEINSNYTFAGIVFRREKLADALSRIINPGIVFFSCSVWNTEYNKALAKLVKGKYPECIIAFGGHSIDENGTFLEDNSFCDLLTFGEGEVTTYKLLLNLLENKIENTPNISFRKDDKIIKTPREMYHNLENYPSPYLTGVFDDIIKSGKDGEFLAVLESNRGCPYSCAYCDWTAGRKMRHFPLEKVFAEIEWFGKNKVEYIFGADSNFGMFDRDLDIANKFVETKRKYGYPKVFRPCYEKNSDERVFSVCKLLNSEKMDKGATFAYQTLSDIALENIGRKNLTMEHFSNLMSKYNDAKIPAYSELILGLPGETYESFCRGLCRLLENGQHNSVSVYYCEALPNSKLTEPSYMKKHGINVIKVGFNHIHSAPKKNEEVKEYSYLVRSTATMNEEDWVKSNLFSVTLQTFHALGVLRFFALYLVHEGKCSYYDFYMGLEKYIENGDNKLKAMFDIFRNKYESSFDGQWNYYNPAFGDVTWFFEEGAFLEFVSDADEMYSLVEPYLKSFDIDPELFDELLKYQKFALRKNENARKENFRYDFEDYFRKIIKGEYTPLKKESCLYTTSSSEFESFAEYAKNIVWFGRRRGATLNEVIKL